MDTNLKMSLITTVGALAMIIVYTVIFSQLMQARLPGVENNYRSCGLISHKGILFTHTRQIMTCILCHI